MRAIFESAFDICYLVAMITLGILMVKNSKGNKAYRLFGIMAVVLGCGDAFHLIPRVIALCTTGLENYTAALGIGKLVTSITMTVFYVLLYHFGLERYAQKDRQTERYVVYALAALRIVLCLLPQNGWTSANPSLTWGILRNIPFLLLGIVVICFYAKQTKQHKDQAFRLMPLAITLSFAFYIPVVLFASTIPMIGMLMIPKTIMYVWIVVMGYRAMKNEL